MKKKLLLAVALVGALSLGSCVDNNESASVTAVRNAKAEQLKGLANLANAQADAATTLANADAALKQAQADYEKANAAYLAAQTATEEARTETEKANAQTAQAAAMVAMAKAQEQIKTIAVKGESALLAAQTDLLTAQNAYQKALLDQANDNAAELTTYFNAYKTAANDLLRKQHDLANAKVTLAQAQAQIITNAELRETQIENNKKYINKAEQNIAAANAQIEVFKKYDSSDAKPALNAAKAELVDLNNSLQNAGNAENAASTTLSNAQTTLFRSTYVDNINKMIPTNVAGIYVTFVSDDKVNGRPSAAEGNYCAVTTDKDGNIVYIPLFTDINGSNEEYSFEPLPGIAANKYDYEENISYYTYESYYDLIADGFKDYQAAVKANIAANQGKALKDAQTANTNAQKALADAQAVVDKAGDKVTVAQKDALDQAKAAADAALTAQNAAEDALEAINKEVAAVDAIIATIQANADANTANMKACNDASLAYAEARATKVQAKYAANNKQAEVYALDAVVNNTYSYTDQYGNTYYTTAENAISMLESSINNYKISITNYKKNILSLENNTSDDEMIANQEQIIADIEAEISVLEKQVEVTKATLEAAINAGSEE